ncbi:hypothetical protein [Saccharothrix sp. HUAS TT1]|uniref:hypothetical protein n=1 Tax=unclassified Saccharothrix TaxID=2593673 RepID=UPI00345C06A3
MARGVGSVRSGERRGKGQPAVEVLRSEADFTDPGLSRERRWLGLFLLVHLVDQNGRMGTAYRRVLRHAAREPEHWAHGRSLGAVRAEVTRWIGLHARPDSPPPWERVVDLLRDAVHPALAADVLATARYLHELATGATGVDPARHPHWLDPSVRDVTTAMIGGPAWARDHGLPVPELPTPDAGPARLEVDSPPRPEGSAYELLWTVVRVHREALARIAELEHELRKLHEENARLSGDVTSWLGDYQPSIPGQARGPRSRRPVADRHLALSDPAGAFTYPLPAGLPESRPGAR